MADYEIATGYLNGLLQEWDSARKPQELTLLECYQDDMRIARGNDTTGTGVAKANTAKPLFMGVTRSKIRSAVAKVNDSLFGNGQWPYDVTAENPELEPFSDTLKTIIDGQLEAMEYRDLMGATVYSTARYGTAWTFGPFNRTKKIVNTTTQNINGMMQIVQQEYEYEEPYFELGNTLDCYPDPTARTMKQAQGIFWVSMFSKNQILALKGKDGYRNVEEAANRPDNAGNDNGSDMAQQLRANLDYWYKDGRIKFVRYFGMMPANKIDKLQYAEDMDSEESDDEMAIEPVDSDDLVNVVVIMAGGLVLKVTVIEDTDKKPVLRQCWENAIDEMWGVGIAENNFAMQKVTNAAFRMFTESKGLALNPMFAVDRSKFLPSEDFKRYPGKVFQFKPGLTPQEQEQALRQIPTVDVSNGWMDLINVAGQFSDDDTGITKYTQGDDSSHLNKTATGISMIMSASSLPLKEVIEHCDKTIEAQIEALIDWNLTFMEPETVKMLYGEEHAARWTQMKQLGKISFIDFKATGTSSFMAKEVLTSKLQAFMSMAMSNEATAKLIDVPEMLKQVWEAMEVGRKLPIIEEAQDGDIPPAVKQQLMQMQETLQQADQTIQGMQAELESKQAEQEAKAAELAIKQQQAATDQFNAETKRAVDMFNAETNRMKAEADIAKQNLSDSDRAEYEAQVKVMMHERDQEHQQAMEDMRRMHEQKMRDMAKPEDKENLLIVTG